MSHHPHSDGVLYISQDLGDTVGIFAVIAGYVLLFVVPTAMIARRKGYSLVLWAVLGLLFGLVALIVIALLPKTKAKKAEQQLLGDSA
jgi:hypothetical protein